MKTTSELKTGKTILAAIFGAMAGVGCMFLFFSRAGLIDPLVLLVSLAGVCFVIGMLLGWIFGATYYRPIGIGALAGTLVLSIPAILLSYGFALLGAPILMAYAAIAAIGAKYSGRILNLVRR